MKNLDKVLSIWEDLEHSYNTMKDKLGVSSRIEFLYKICGKKGDTDSIDSIKLRLKSELSSYNDEEFSKYSKLIATLDAVKQLISRKDVEDVTDLNMAVLVALNMDKNTKTNNRELPSEFFNNIRKFKFDNPTPLQPLDLFNKSGIFSDSYGYNEDGEFYYNALDTSKFTDIVTFTKANHLEEFIDYYNTNRAKLPPFHTKVFKALDALNEMGKLSLDYVYVSSRYFEVKDNKILFHTGQTLKQNIVSTFDIGSKCYLANVKGKLESFPVVFIE